jgi:hypothetical protein
MKTLKIVVVITLAIVAAALLTATACAYTGGIVTNLVPKGTSHRGNYGRMMGSGGMVRGYAYYTSGPVNTAPPTTGQPSTTTPPAPSNQYPLGGWCCFGMRSSLP